MNSIAIQPLPNQRQGRRMLALVASLLALPFVIAAGLYFGGWQPARTLQHGVLLAPPMALPASGLLKADGAALPTAELHGKWLLVLSLDGPCRQACLARIDEMRRIQVSLNKEMGRLRRVVLSEQASDPALSRAGRMQPDLLVLGAPFGWLTTGHHLHIVDPQGRRVMDYPAEVSAREVRSDLERLLKFAWTG
jgi:hypothetical protein